MSQYDNQIGRNIRTAREHCKLNPDELGDKIGVNGNMIEAWEEGDENPSDEDLEKIGEACGLRRSIPRDGILGITSHQTRFRIITEESVKQELNQALKDMISLHAGRLIRKEYDHKIKRLENQIAELKKWIDERG